MWSDYFLFCIIHHDAFVFSSVDTFLKFALDLVALKNAIRIRHSKLTLGNQSNTQDRKHCAISPRE